MCSYKLKQPNEKGRSCELKRIYICCVHQGLLPQTSLGGLHLLSSPSLSLPILVRLLPRGNLGLYLFYCAYKFNSLGICVQVCMMCLHVHSLRICAWVLSVLTHEGVLGEWSIRDDKGELVREHDLLEVLVTFKGASLLGKKNLLRSLVVILTYEEFFEDMWSIGEDFIFLHSLLGNLCWLYPRGGFINFTGTIFFTTHEGLVIVL